MTNQNITQQTTQTYDKIAPDYADRWCDFSLDEELDAFTSYVKPGRLILDLGCGPGRDMLDLRERGYPVVGLDRSTGMLKEAAKRNVGPLVQADMRHPPFARHSFKGVWASASMLHLTKADFSPALRGIYNLLDHGHVFLAVKEGDGESWWEAGEHGERFFDFYHPAEVELALERANFHVLWFKINPDSRRRHNWINAIGWTRLETVKTGANAVIFNNAGQVLLTRRADNGKWCVPGGHLDPGEPIENTAIREALEETGLHVEIEKLTGMYNVTYPAHIFPEKKARYVFIVSFRCKIIGGELTLNDEVTEFGWFDPHDLPSDLIMYHEERILDALPG